MPIALILQIFTIAQAAAAGAPAAIEAVNRVRALIGKHGEKVTVDQLVNALAGAEDAHEELQNALNRSPVAVENTTPEPKGGASGPKTTASPLDFLK